MPEALDIVEIYRRRGKWRWRYKAAGNWKIMATGAEAYTNYADICDSAARVLNLVPFAARYELHFRVSRQGGWPDVLVVVSQ